MVAEIITAIVSTITTFLTGIGSAIIGLFDEMFLDDLGKLTTFATVSFVFIGISFAMWVVSKVFYLIKG